MKLDGEPCASLRSSPFYNLPAAMTSHHYQKPVFSFSLYFFKLRESFHEGYYTKTALNKQLHDLCEAYATQVLHITQAS
jgi:hypothetical protein